MNNNSMLSRVYGTVERPSVRLCVSRRSTATAVCGGFAAERPVGRRYRSTAAGTLRAPCSSKCGQRHVCNRRSEETAYRLVIALFYTKLNTLITYFGCMYIPHLVRWLVGSQGKFSAKKVKVKSGHTHMPTDCITRPLGEPSSEP